MSLETKFNSWIEQINEAENTETDIIAFYFGLFETPNGFSMYLIGSKEYYADDDDWACNNDFEPKNKYMAFPTEFSDGKGWEEILNAAKKLIRDYTASDNFQNSFFKNAKAIATGFDDGDLILIKSK